MHLLLFLAAFVSAAFGILMLAFGGSHVLAPLAANPLVMAAVTWLLGAALLVILGVIAARIRRLADALEAQRLPAMLTPPAPPAAPVQPDIQAEPAIPEAAPQPPVAAEPAVAVRPDAQPAAVPEAAPPPAVASPPVATPHTVEPAAGPIPDPATLVPEPLVPSAAAPGAVPSSVVPLPVAPPVAVEPSAPAPVTAWPRVDPSDRIVPADSRVSVPPVATNAPEVSIAADEVVPSAPAGPPTVLKSGVVEGMAYTLYSDGSVEAELPVGIVHFASISEWRAHMQAQS